MTNQHKELKMTHTRNLLSIALLVASTAAISLFFHDISRPVSVKHVWPMQSELLRSYHDGENFAPGQTVETTYQG
jgi:hypothetical protein